MSIPLGVERHLFRRARVASMLEGVARRRARRGRGAGLGREREVEGIGSPEGRSAMVSRWVSGEGSAIFGGFIFG